MKKVVACGLIIQGICLASPDTIHDQLPKITIRIDNLQAQDAQAEQNSGGNSEEKIVETEENKLANKLAMVFGGTIVVAVYLIKTFQK